MSDIMKGLGLAHTLAEAMSNSQAQFGNGRSWTDNYVNALTTNDGKSRILGPMLDVLRGDAEVVPVKRVVYPSLVKPGDKDEFGNGVVVLNRTRFGIKRVPHRLVVGEFTLGVASRSVTSLYEREGGGSGRLVEKPSTHIDVPDDRKLLALSKRHLLPRHLFGRMLPGIALRDFYLKNPHHIPKHFCGIVLFWGTICKNNWYYYVPGINGRSEYGRRICTYQVVDWKDVISYDEDISFNPYDAAVFI